MSYPVGYLAAKVRKVGRVSLTHTTHHLLRGMNKVDFI